MTRPWPAAFVVALFWASSVPAAQDPEARRDSGSPETSRSATRVFGVSALSDGRVGYHIDANGVLRPEPFYLNQPGRLVVDFPGTTVRGPRSLPPAIDPVRSLRMAQFIAGPSGVVRFVLEVDRSVRYVLTPDPAGATLEFPDAQAVEPVAASTPKPVPSASAPEDPAPAPSVPPTPAPEPTAHPAPKPATAAAPGSTEGAAPFMVSEVSPPGYQTGPTETAAPATESVQPVHSTESVQLQRPGPAGAPIVYELPAIDPSRVPPPEPFLPRESLAVPDRWRIMETLGVIKEKFRDPYNQNVFKGDKPYAKWGDDVFLSLLGVSETIAEGRRLPIPVGAQSSRRPGALDLFDPSHQLTLAQSVILGASIIKGNTTFKPPDYEYRLILAANLNRTQVEPIRALRIDPRRGFVRYDNHVAVVEAFYDKHRQNVSERYDFDSYRIGIQPMISDFRGFIFQDNALGLRYFGNRDNNLKQYNLAAFIRMEKDTNTGLIDVLQRPRKDLVLLANLYRQDFPVLGNTTQVTVINNWNLEDDENYYNKNGILERPAALGDARPHKYNVTYLGVTGDGHFGAWNLNTSWYGAIGRDSRHPLAQRPQTILAGFGSLELSRDFDWVRGRVTLIGATGDKDPFDGKATGFDAIQENPQIAGADTSFWIRQAVPLAGGGEVALSGRNGILPSLRSSKDQGQSNFVNPGLMFAGVGADFDLTPQLRVVTNVSGIAFANTTVLSVLRNQGRLDRFVGIDTSLAVQIRPLMTQNIVFNVSGAALLPGRSFKQLYDEDRRGPQYSILMNLQLSY